MEEPEGLNAEQRASLAMFSEVTAGVCEPQDAVQLLQACNWNIEQAMQLHWARADDASPAAGADRDIREPLLGDLDREATPGPVASFAERGQNPSGRVGGLANCSGAFGWVVRSLWRFGVSVLRVICIFIFGPVARFGAGQNSGAALPEILRRSYGQQLELPRFFEGSFAQALQKARRDVKLLAIYLHSENSRFTQAFCTEVLSNDFVRQMLDENFVVWGGDTAAMETHFVAQQTIRARAYPCLCVLLPASVDEIRVIGAAQGDIKVAAAVGLFTKCLEAMDTHRAELVARRAQQDEDRMLREEQDREYRQALEMDRKRAEQEQVEAAERMEAQRLAEEEQRRQEEAAARLEAAQKQLGERRRRSSESMAAPGPDATSRILLRLPAGQRVERKFRAAAKLAEVYEWVDCLAFLPEHAAKNLEIPSKFRLKTSYPTRELTEMDQSIQELQLAGSVLLIEEIEEEEEACK